MATEAAPILAVIDCAADDAEVVAEAAWLARAAHTYVLLVHVARPPLTPQHTSFEQRVLSDLQALADRVRVEGAAARVDDVYFGDASAEVAYAANYRRARAVVAARRPTRFPKLLGWRSRDRRLARLLNVPLVLVDATHAEKPSPAEFELRPQAWSTALPARKPAVSPSSRQRAA